MMQSEYLPVQITPNLRMGVDPLTSLLFIDVFSANTGHYRSDDPLYRVALGDLKEYELNLDDGRLNAFTLYPYEHRVEIDSDSLPAKYSIMRQAVNASMDWCGLQTDPAFGWSVHFTSPRATNVTAIFSFSSPDMAVLFKLSIL